MKKLLALFVMILMLVSSFSICAYAEDVAKLTLSNVTVQKGETVEMPVKLVNNKGFWGFAVNVCFDTNAFEVKEVRTKGEVFNSSDIMIGPADISQEGYVRILVTPADVSKNNTNNGVVCTIVLEQTKSAVATTYPFTFDYEENDCCDVDGNVVTVASVDGSVSIVDDEKSTTPTKAEDKTTKTKASNDDLGEVIAKAEDNKIIDEYANQNQTQAPTNGDVQDNKNEDNENSEIVDLNEEDATAQSVVSTGNAVVFGYYILAAVVLAGIVVLIIVLIKKSKKK